MDLFIISIFSKPLIFNYMCALGRLRKKSVAFTLKNNYLASQKKTNPQEIWWLGVATVPVALHGALYLQVLLDVAALPSLLPSQTVQLPSFPYSFSLSPWSVCLETR